MDVKKRLSFGWCTTAIGVVLALALLSPRQMRGAETSPLPADEQVVRMEKELLVLRDTIKRQTANYTELQATTAKIEAERKAAWDAYRTSEAKRHEAEAQTEQAMALTHALVARLVVVEDGFTAACDVGMSTATGLLHEAKADRETLVVAATQDAATSQDTLRQRLRQTCNEKMERASRLMRIFEKDGGP